MQTVQGDTAALVAAALVQAEFAGRGTPDDPSDRFTRRLVDKRGPVVAAYRYYLELVTTGKEPVRAVVGDDGKITHTGAPKD